jgi:hypothetical protein
MGIRRIGGAKEETMFENKITVATAELKSVRIR